MNSTTSGTPSPERRASPRKSTCEAVRVHVTGSGWSDSFELEARDISETGLFVYSDFLFPLGQVLDLEYGQDNGRRRVRRLGRVGRVTSDKGAAAGMAVRLFGTPDRRRSRPTPV